MTSIGERHKSSLQLYETGKEIKKEADNRKAIGWGLCTGALLLFLSVVAIRNSRSDIAKAIGLSGALGLLGGAIAISYRDELTEKKAQQYELAAKTRLSMLLNSDHQFATLVSKIENTQDEINLIGMLPVEQQYHWYSKLGLLDMVQIQTQAAIEATPQGFSAVRPRSAMTLSPEDCDTSWLTEEFAYRSKVVCAEGGSGKTNYLNWEMSKIDPGHLVIIDPHLKKNQLDAGGSYWLQGVSVEEERKIVASDPAKIGDILRNVLAEGRARLAGEGKTDHPIHIIFDEGDAAIVCGRGGPKAVLLEFLQESANEFRKVGITITLTLHTLKKGQTGIDASILGQMTWLLLGGFIASMDVVWPADINQKELIEAQATVQAGLDINKARACVLRLRGGGQTSVSIVAMPRIDLQEVRPDPSMSESLPESTQGDQGILETLSANLGGRATIEQIKTELTRLSGSTPTDQALYYAIQESGIEVIE